MALCANPERPTAGRLGRIISALRSRREALRAKGILSLSVFGSIARGDDDDTSDLDLLYAVDPRRPEFDVFDLAGIADELSAALGLQVDLVARERIPHRMADTALREEVVVFQ